MLKLGGFVFDAELSGKKIGTYAKVMKEFSRKNRLVAVTGGGSIARKYIAAARELGASEFVCDQIGIHVSRLNARILAWISGVGAVHVGGIHEQFCAHGLRSKCGDRIRGLPRLKSSHNHDQV